MALANNYFTVEQAAAYLGVVRRTIYTMLKGGMPHEIIGRQKLIAKGTLDAYKPTCHLCHSTFNRYYRLNRPMPCGKRRYDCVDCKDIFNEHCTLELK